MPRYLLQFGLAFAFAYAAIAGFFAPANWIGYFPSFMHTAVSPDALILLFGIYGVFLAVWLLTGYARRGAGIVAGITLLSIAAFNIPQIDIVFRDISLGMAALALAFMKE